MLKKKTMITFTLIGIAAMGLMAVQSKSRKNDSSKDIEKKEKEKPVLHVEATETLRRDIHTFIESTATLKCNRQVDIMSKAAGQIKELMTEEGILVMKDDILLTLDTQDAQLQLEQSIIQTKKADREFKRAQTLFKQSLVTQEDFEMKKFDLEKATADQKMAQYKLDQMSIKAPFDGMITNRYCEIGQNISSADKLFTIAQISTLKAEVFLPEHQTHGLKEGQRVILSRNNAFQNTITGKIDRLAPIVDATTGTLKVTIALTPEDNAWRPGSYAHLRIITGTYKNALVLPRKALVYNNKQETSVFLIEKSKNKKETVKRITVQTGAEELGYIAITKGLKKGDRVVLTGKESLKNGEPVTTS